MYEIADRPQMKQAKQTNPPTEAQLALLPALLVAGERLRQVLMDGMAVWASSPCAQAFLTSLDAVKAAGRK